MKAAIDLMKQLAIYGNCGGVLIASMQFVEYRFLYERMTTIDDTAA